MTDRHADSRLILALLAMPRVGRKTAARLLELLDSHPRHPDELAAAVTNAVTELRGVQPVTESDATHAFAVADEALDRAAELGLKVLPLGSPDFPSRLKTIPDSPLILYLKGNPEPTANDQAVAIIGTRNPTEFGLRTAHRFAVRCAEAGLVVVSGLAKSCDAAAHEGCLDAHGKTVAVLAHGLDTVSPASNRKLAERLLDEGGALLSEYSPGTRARSSFFVERDRLQSGLARAVLVIETDIKGGTMHTVRFAREQRRRIACLDHPKHLHAEPSTRGTQKLIREGTALPLTNGPDLARLIEEVKLGQEPTEDTTYEESLFPVDGAE